MSRFMRYLFVIAFWGLGLAWAHAADAPAVNPSQETAAPQEAPAIQIAEDNFDFGEAIEGEEVSHAYQVKNTGAATLHISQVRPG
jgi:hypothetical protein